MIFPGNMPNSNMGDPRLYQGFGMRPPSFPTSISAPVRNDAQFPGNPNLDRNAFSVGQSEAMDTAKNVQPRPKLNRNRTRVLVELPKEVEKDAANDPQNQQVVSRPQSSGGYPGFNFPRPPMSFPGNMPNSNMGDPRLHQGFGMRPPSFPTSISAPVRNDAQFPGNPNLDSNGFWVGQSEAMDTTKNVQPRPEENRNQTRVLVELSKEVENANDPQNQQVVSRPQSSGGYPGFNFPPPPMIFPGNMPNSNMGDPSLHQGFGMRPPSFPSSISAPVRNDAQFPGNPNLDSNGFWVGQSEAMDTTKNVQPRPEENRNQTRVLAELPTEVQKANDPQNQQVSRPQSSGVPNAPNNPKPKKSKSARKRERKLDAELRKKTEEMPPFIQKTEVMMNNIWRKDTSNMYSCDLCQFYTPDDNLMEKHLHCYRHNWILQHLCEFFPRKKVILLQDHLICKKNKMLIENKKSNIVPFNDRLGGIRDQQFFHRIQAAYCQACDVLIPEVQSLMREHIASAVHRQHCQATLSKTKCHSSAVAAEMLETDNMGEKPFNHVSRERNPLSTPQVSGTNEVLVAEEDEEDNDDTNDKDAIDYARDDPEVPVTHNESPAHETKVSDKKMFLPDEPEMNEPATSSMIATTCNRKRNSPAGPSEYFPDEEYISQILKKYWMEQDPFNDVAVQPPQISSTNEALVTEEHDDTNDEARDDPEVPVTHNESSAHETKN